MMNENIEIGQLCRLCLINENVEVNIFNEQNPYSEIFLKIASCLPIQISFEDELPKKICNNCSSRLDSFHDFYNATLSAEKQLINWLECSVVNDSVRNGFESLNEINLGIDSSGILDFHFDQIGEEYQSQIIPVTNQNNESNRRIVKWTEDIGQSTLPDHLQNRKRPNTRLTLKKVAATALKEDELKRQSLQLPNSRNRKKSLNKSSDSVKKKKPLKNQQNTTVICDVCNLKFEKTDELALHSIEHSTDGKYTCPVCGNRTPLKHAMIIHAQVHDGTWKFKCEVCQKGFASKTHASEHKYLHSGEKPFQCEVCGRAFTFSRALKEHRSTQHYDTISGVTKRAWDCTICNKEYTTSAGLRIHNITKHSTVPVDKSVVCDMCGKRLSNKNHLELHRRIHTGYKPYVCKFCSKSFISGPQLQTHERTHTGEKPFVCTECGGRFTQQTSLRIHQRSHTGERPYVCKLCDKGFTSKSAMKSHSRSFRLWIHRSLTGLNSVADVFP